MRPASSLVAASLLTLAIGPLAAEAQFTGDPFNPYRNAYNASSFPSYSNVGPLSRSYRYTGPLGIGLGNGLDNAPAGELPYVVGLSNQFSNGGVLGVGAPAIPGLVDPATRGYRPASRADAQFNDRQLRRESDFAQAQQEREALYFEAQDEKDPARRADLMKKYRSASRRANLRSNRSPVATADDADSPPGLPRSSRTRDTPQTQLPTTYIDMLRYNRTLAAVLYNQEDQPPPLPSQPPGR